MRKLLEDIPPKEALQKDIEIGMTWKQLHKKYGTNPNKLAIWLKHYKLQTNHAKRIQENIELAKIILGE